jgi:hypothetical protein
LGSCICWILIVVAEEELWQEIRSFGKCIEQETEWRLRLVILRIELKALLPEQGGASLTELSMTQF